MKKVISVFLIIFCCTISFVSCGKDVPELGDMDEFFPRTTADAEFAEKFEFYDLIAEEDKADFDSNVNVYYGTNKYGLLYKIKLLKNFGFWEMNLLPESKLKSDTLWYEKGNKSLVIYKETGRFEYENSDGKKGSPITDLEKAEKNCEEILEKYDLLPKNYAKRVYLSNVTDKGNVCGARFTQIVDGRRVVGSAFITINVNGDGETVSVRDSTVDYDYFDTYKTMPYKEACEKLYDKSTFFTCDFSYGKKIDKVVFEEVELIYCKYPYNDYFVPCFEYRGTAYSGEETTDITAYMVAVENF